MIEEKTIIRFFSFCIKSIDHESFVYLYPIISNLIFSANNSAAKDCKLLPGLY